MEIVGSKMESGSEILIHRYSQRSVHHHLSTTGIDKYNSGEMNQAFLPCRLIWKGCNVHITFAFSPFSCNLGAKAKLGSFNTKFSLNY